MTAAARYNGTAMLNELQEFAGFAKGTQRYIRRSLDVGLARCDAVARWSRHPGESASIEAQMRVYRGLDAIRALIPDDNGLDQTVPLIAPLVAMLGFDLGQGRLPSFASCRFLYERLIGAAVRPFLPTAFCAAATLPHLHPAHRLQLVMTLSQEAVGAAGWSCREPRFLPAWVEKVDHAVDAQAASRRPA